MSTPAITLTATLDDLVGNAAGSSSNPAKLRICLCGYGPQLPRIVGTTMLAKVGPTNFFSSGSAISTLIWGNDVITPAGTYYSIEILDGNDNVVQCGTYILTGGGTQDLSNLQPVIPPVPLQPGNPVLLALDGSTPGTVFTLPTPSYNGLVYMVFYRGLLQRPTTDYTFNPANNQVTMTYSVNEAPYAFYTPGIG